MISGSLFFYQNWLTFLLALWLSFLLTKAPMRTLNLIFCLYELAGNYSAEVYMPPAKNPADTVSYICIPLKKQ